MGGSATMQAGTRVNAEQASKRVSRKPTLLRIGEGRGPAGKRATWDFLSRTVTGILEVGAGPRRRGWSSRVEYDLDVEAANGLQLARCGSITLGLSEWRRWVICCSDAVFHLGQMCLE